jgi:hypothetical protein
LDEGDGYLTQIKKQLTALYRYRISTCGTPEEFVLQFVGQQIEEFDLILDGDPHPRVFNLLYAQTGACEQRLN